tara:strand:- start:470 stop:976 length:507 start_codon:yes stop_codon:yes gene_type:complete
MKEEFREVKGYEDYEISNLGRVKSLARIVTTVRGSRVYKEKILKPGLGSNGYLVVVLSKGGKSKTKVVHQLVAESFLNHKPCGLKLVVDHINNVKTDNRLENLQIITNRENSSKDRKGGTSKYIGVTWFKRDKKWMAAIKIDGKRKHLGLFLDEKEAGQAYQVALNSL